jgi:cyclic pyranopterin phosphate synthase
MTGLSDTFNRPINYLRISVTDRCNLRCIYCLPPEGIPLLPHGEVLTYEEIAGVAGLAAELGINKVRLTGGEPLVRARLSELVAMLTGIDGIDDISLTTNGVLLKQYAAELKQAGLKRVNVSLDSLNRDKFERISCRNNLDEVLNGIEAAKACGLNPVKVNMVVMRGINDDEVMDFARLTITEDWHVRFIELMPFAADNPPDGHSIVGRANIYPAFRPDTFAFRKPEAPLASSRRSASTFASVVIASALLLKVSSAPACSVTMRLTYASRCVAAPHPKN